MITVLHVITRLEMGGAQENTLDTCARLDRRRFRVGLLFGPGGRYDARAAAIPALMLEPIPDLVREVSPARDLRAVAALRASIARARLEHEALGLPPRAFIVHTHSSKAGVVGRLAARLAGAPIVVHSIHGFGFHEGQRRPAFEAFLRAEQAAARLTDAFISVSVASLAEAQARKIVTPRHVARVIRSGFLLEPFLNASAPERRAAARAALGLGEGEEVIVSIANLKPQKDPLTLVEALRRVVVERPRALVLYAGDGELRPEVEAAIRGAGLEGRFRLLGWREDVPELLAAADVVALASIFEGLPRSAVQAVAAGRPFVGTRVDGTSEIIRDGQNGYLVPPRDPAALARALARALEERPVDPRDRERVRAWDVEAMVEAQAALYTELVEASSSRR